MADLDSESVSKLRVVDLREHLSNRGLPTSGLKADLVKRLREALASEQDGDRSANINNPENPISTESDEQTSDELENQKHKNVESSSDDQITTSNAKAIISDEQLEQEKNILRLKEEQAKAEEERKKIEEKLEAEKKRAEEEQKQAEKKRAEEQKQAEKKRLQIEENKRVEEEKRLRAEEEKRIAEEKKKAEEQERLRIEKIKKAEQERLKVEKEKLRVEEEKRKAENLKIEKEKLRVEEERKKAEEERKRAEIERLKVEEEKKKAEAERLRIEEEKRAEAERVKEEKRKAEAERIEKEKKKAEAERIEKEKRKAEAERIEKEKRKAEAKRIEEQRKAEEGIKEEKRKAEAKRIEENRKAEVKRIEEERRKAEVEKLKIEEEKRKVEAKRIEEERKKAEAQKLRVEEENRKAEAQKLRVEEEKRKAEAERLKVEEEKRKAEIERLKVEERRKAEAERLRVLEEKRKEEAEKLRIEEEKRMAEAERLRIEEKIIESERLKIEDEKKREAERLRIEEKKKAEVEKLRVEEEKKIAAETEKKRMAIEEEMKKEQERWLVEEQMRRAQEQHKKRLQAEEQKQKRILEEQQKLMEEELARQKSEQQLYELQQKALLEKEVKKEFSIKSEKTTNSSLSSNSTPFVSVPATMNIVPPPPTILISNIPPPSIISTSHATIVPNVQVSAPPTRFAPPPLPINITAPITPPQSFISQLDTEIGSKPGVNGTLDSDVIENMDTSENTADIRLPQALEKVLALKTERAQQLGVDPDAVVQPIPAVEEKIHNTGKSNVVTLVSVDEDEYAEEVNTNKRESKRRRKKKKKKRSIRTEEKNEINKRSENQKSKEIATDVDVEYVQETIDISDPLYSQFMKIFEKFKLTDGEKDKEETPTDAGKEMKEELFNPMAFRKKPMDLDDDDDDDDDQDEDKKEDKPKLSKRKLKKLSRMTVAELKQKVNRPELVEMHDVTAKDPVLLLHLKASRNTVPVPRHWCFKRKYLQGKRGIEKPAFELPDFIKRTGIMEMRQALQEKEDQKTMKAKMRERVRPKLGKIDIDYQKLHDAFFKWQTKPRMTIHGDLYYEGKEFETRLKEKKPGDLSEDLRTALGMPTGPNANKCPPPWLIAMQRYGPPPSYPNLKIPGLNAPIPESCLFGYHAGGWGKPPVDETGRPLYGDVFGTQIADNQPNIQEEEIDHTLWGELESESSEEEEEEEEDEEDEEEDKQEDETGLVTPAEGLITPSGFSSIPAGMETPDMIELRKRKIEAEKEGGETPALYTILPEKKTERVGAAMMGSTHIYDLAAAIPASKMKMGGTTSVPPQGIEVALDPSELEMDTAAMAARYEQTMREQQSQLEKEDLSDMVAEHAARQKNKRKKQQLDSAKPPKKYKEFKF